MLSFDTQHTKKLRAQNKNRRQDDVKRKIPASHFYRETGIFYKFAEHTGGRGCVTGLWTVNRKFAPSIIKL